MHPRDLGPSALVGRRLIGTQERYSSGLEIVRNRRAMRNRVHSDVEPLVGDLALAVGRDSDLVGVLFGRGPSAVPRELPLQKRVGDGTFCEDFGFRPAARIGISVGIGVDRCRNLEKNFASIS